MTWPKFQKHYSAEGADNTLVILFCFGKKRKQFIDFYAGCMMFDDPEKEASLFYPLLRI